MPTEETHLQNNISNDITKLASKRRTLLGLKVFYQISLCQRINYTKQGHSQIQFDDFETAKEKKTWKQAAQGRSSTFPFCVGGRTQGLCLRIAIMHNLFPRAGTTPTEHQRMKLGNNPSYQRRGTNTSSHILGISTLAVKSRGW